jgi:hypothetical protein
MAKETRTREQLRNLIIEEAQASGKCSDLVQVIVLGPIERPRSNWDIATRSTHPTHLLSSDCRNELSMITGRLEAKYNLSKDRKTASELERMISKRLDLGGTFIKVHSDPAYGWHATVVTAPAQAIAVQQTVEQIAAELRTEFDLEG